MKGFYFLMVALMAITCNVFGQASEPTLTGEVTFMTTQNVYVKFDDTDRIEAGDTLRLSKTNVPCLVVKSKSSNSCVCSIIDGTEVQKGDAISFSPKPLVVEEVVEEFVPVIADADADAPKKESLYKEKIRGRASLSDYSTLSNLREDRHRLVGRILMNAQHFKDSKYSLDSYLIYTHNLNPTTSTVSSLNDSFLRVYSLGVRYDATPTLSVTVGRNINSKTSSLGAIDGIQAEKYFGKQYVGAIAGFRPDIFDYGFNPDLMQYGAYLGTSTDLDNFVSETTLGFIEQRNGGAIDRRYTYFQHSSTVAKDLTVFSSLEMDLFGNVNGVSNSKPRLTNLYVSGRYRFSKKVNLMLSYDSRKRILYYETFQTEIERLLDDDIARQGARARVNIRPFKNVLAGASYSKRFQSDNQNNSDNIYGYVTYSRLPQIGGSLNLSYNRNASNYLESNIASIRHSRDIMDGRLHADFYYRFVNYNYTNISAPSNQHFFGTDLSYYINRKLMFSLSGEMSMMDNENTYRIYTQITQRF